MRLGSGSSDGFIAELDTIGARIQKGFADRMAGHTVHVPVKVMLGDATVTEQNTFDPGAVKDYFDGMMRRLGPRWDVQDPAVTNNDDIRRIFAKFQARIGSYLLSGHVSVQFHVLLYYKTDHRVVDAQKELAQIVDLAAQKESLAAEEGDRLVLDRLRRAGHADLDAEGLFRVLFEDDALREAIQSDVRGGAGDEFDRLTKRRQELFDELDGLLIETYHTSPVPIDDARLVTGEEGFLCTFDLEIVRDGRGGAREGVFDPRRMSRQVRQEIRDRLAEFEAVV